LNDEHDHPKRPSRARHRDLIAALASGFVGAVALATSTYNVYLQRQQVRAQVWPRVVLKTAYSKEKGFSSVVANRGVGPAEIKRVGVRIDGKLAEDWYGVESTFLHRPDFSATEISPIEDEVVSPGLEITWFHIQDPVEGREFLTAIEGGAHGIDIDICYCSTLGDCWTLDSSEPIKGNCVPDPHPFHSISVSSVKNAMTTFAEEAKKPPEADGGSGHP
jgi:hypothetical protein